MSRAEAYERWIRTSFIEMNTELEELYFARANRGDVIGCGDSIKVRLRDEGRMFVTELLLEGNTGDGFDSAFGVLGSVGMYLAALRRHELTNPMREERSPFPEASSLALHLGASLGMAPRFSTAHLATHNRARAGVRKSFTSLADEFLFIDENTRGILSLQRAADALGRIVHLGVSSPVADVMFEEAKLTASFTRFGRITSRIASAGRSTAAPMRATFPASTKSTCCSASAARTIPITPSFWSTRCYS
jgi:hypothetical protein